MKEKTQNRIGFLIGLALLALGLMFAGPIGCKSTLAPGGVYAGDSILYQADKVIVTSYGTFQKFVKWEADYRSVLPVEVSQAADVIRQNAKKWIDSASAMRETYAALPDAANRDKLSSALTLIQTALAEVSKYQTKFKSIAPPKI